LLVGEENAMTGLCARMTGALLLICAALARAAAAPEAASVRSLDLWPSARGSAEVLAQPVRSPAERPRIDIYRPAHPNGAAVLVIAGGGYAHIAIDKEAVPAARWLVANGVTAAVLHYRLPGDGVPVAAPFQDAQRAMRILRADAAALGIDPAHIGVLGFSAGGHLAGIIVTRFGDAFYAAADAIDRVSSRPDFAALIYPVVSMQPPLDTTQASRRLSAEADAATAYSVQLHVSGNTPPVFLAHAVDDPIASVNHSRLMADALLREHVPFELHLFERGGHGWGLGAAGTPVSAWPSLFTAWARGHGFLPAQALPTGQGNGAPP
jgi:acetyl esterase/lipase